MPITSLNNFGVPTDGGNQVLLMPKLQYRFRVTLLGFGTEAATELTKQVADVSRPQIDFEPMTLDVYNSKVYLAGKHTINTVQLTLRDDASGFVQRLVGQQLQKQFDFVEQASARSGVDYKFTTRIEILDGGNANLAPSILETFNLYGCFLTSANYNELNYANNEPVTVTLTIQPDNVEQYAAGETEVSAIGGIGASVGRALSDLGQSTTGASQA